MDGSVVADRLSRDSSLQDNLNDGLVVARMKRQRCLSLSRRGALYIRTENRFVNLAPAVDVALEKVIQVFIRQSYLHQGGRGFVGLLVEQWQQQAGLIVVCQARDSTRCSGQIVEHAAYRRHQGLAPVEH